MTLQREEMRTVRWMCNVKVKDRISSKELRERLGIDDILVILILQQNRLRWYGHVLQKEDTDWVKKCVEYEVEGSRPRGRPKRTWKEVVQKDAKHVIWTSRMLWIVVDQKADKDWMMIRMVGGWVFLLVPAHPGSPGQRAVKRLLCVVYKS